MNKIHRIIWSRVRNAFIVVGELTRSAGKSSTCDQRSCQTILYSENTAKVLHKHRLTRLAAAMLMALGSSSVFAVPATNALPTGGQIASGNGSISQSGANMTVQQNSDKLIANWQSFDIGSQASVTFNQPGSDSIALNRVLGQDPSQIMGQLNANGQVMLVNPAGVVFGAGSQINVGGITATTLNISDADFLAGHYHFSDSNNAAAVENLGHILANGGVVALVAPIVKNAGSIETPNGSTALVAGNDVTLDFSGDGLISVTVNQSKLDSLVENKGAIRADEGLVILTAGAASDLLSGVVNNQGIVEAQGITQQGGRIVLDGGDVTNDGRLDVSSNVASGGNVEITGQNLVLAENSTIDATGATGGGNVLVGGDWQGGANEARRVFDEPNALHQATTVTMKSGASIDASATDSGDGGTVVLWSDIENPDSVTAAHGAINAKGGEQGGDGGQIETSGASLNTDNVKVNAGAENGVGGLWLLDPYNYNIDAAAASSIVSALNTETSVEVETSVNNTTYGSDGDTDGNGDITLSSAITAEGLGGLILNAAGNIALNAEISIAGSLTLNSDAIAIGESITTGGAQHYSGDVSIAATSVSLSTVRNSPLGKAITFGGDINGISANANSLFMLSGGGAIDVTGSVGNTHALNFFGLGGTGMFVPGSTTNLTYTGGAQTYTATYAGTYTFYVWGAQGGTGLDTSVGGKGGYAYGEYILSAGQEISIYVGGKGASARTGGWNGGGQGGLATGAFGGQNGAGGGGATDIRVGGTALENRMIVAGGGGGGVWWLGAAPQGGAGGGSLVQRVLVA
ncbi:two-partner secretion domain-containing protein, partial [Nitrincola sp. A-D6]|uniref:two-partner secretion domain-containing protein n=1 Tax=Nitrincola sp. A-D6 TaxID=1545442 RepID=UPI00118652AA